MIFTIEPMINQGRPETRLLGDGWTAITRDRKLSAQWEHTVLVTADGYEILTLRNDETFRAPRQPDPARLLLPAVRLDARPIPAGPTPDSAQRAPIQRINAQNGALAYRTNR